MLGEWDKGETYDISHIIIEVMIDVMWTTQLFQTQCFNIHAEFNFDKSTVPVELPYEPQSPI